jgi:hypothetical protein
MYHAIIDHLYNQVLDDLKTELDEAAAKRDDSAVVLLKCILYRSL